MLTTCSCFFVFLQLQTENFCVLNSNPGTVVPRFLSSSLFKQFGFRPKIGAKNPSEFEQNFGVRTLGLGTEKSQLESKRTLRSISREQKEPSGAKTHSADRFIIKTDRFLIKEKRKATAQPDSLPKKKEDKKP